MFEGGLGFPSKFLFGFGGVAEKEIHFGGAEVFFVDADDGFFRLFVDADFFESFAFPLEVNAQKFGAFFDKFSYAVGFSRGKNEILGRLLLEHSPHSFDVVLGIAPVTFGIEVSEIETVVFAGHDARKPAGDFFGNKRFSASGGFMVKENAVARIHIVTFSIVDGNPVGI